MTEQEFKIKLKEILNSRSSEPGEFLRIDHLKVVAPWARRIANTFDAKQALYTYWHRLRLTGSQSIYYAFCRSENWGNGGATTYVETLSRDHAFAIADRYSDNWFARQFSERAAELGYELVEHTAPKGGEVWEMKTAAPSREEFAAWLTSQFPEIPQHLDCRLLTGFTLGEYPQVVVEYSNGSAQISEGDLESIYANQGPKGFVGFLEPTLD